MRNRNRNNNRNQDSGFISENNNNNFRRGIGPGGNCVCPSCGKTISHQTGIPCTSVKCPSCNVSMIRE